MNKLHPGAKWQFRIGGYFMFGIPGIVLCIAMIAPSMGILFSLMEDSNIPEFSNIPIAAIATLSIIIYIIFVIVASEIYAQMSYNRWFYEFTKDGLRLERGIIWKKYSNVPYERIQNIDINRGIIARMLGFSSIMIQTAGYSAQTQAEGHIPAVEMKEAEKIRSLIMKKITGKRKTK
jgi:membrane protein YdbS with pleckstrin-like domain